MSRALRPDVEKFVPQIRVGKVGDALAIAAHPFANPITNPELLELAISSGLPATDTEKAWTAITGPRFKARGLNHLPTKELNLKDALQRQATIGALLLKQVMHEMNWDNIDAYIDTSAFLPVSINDQILDQAGLLGRDILQISYRYACAGALTALVDILSQSEYANRPARIVIGANEPLSLLMHPKHLSTLENLHIPALFSDGHAALAVDSSKINLRKQRVLVKPDGGVIRLIPNDDPSETQHDPSAVPDYYRFTDNADGLLHYSRRSRVLSYHPPGDQDLSVSIDGMGTLKFFGVTTADEIRALLEADPVTAPNELLNIILHPASEPVLKLISKRLRSTHPHIGELPFRMDKTDLANSSSATILNYWLDMILKNEFDPSRPNLWVAPGIGSVTTTALGEIYAQ